MRISDWSSDVCSSDLLLASRRGHEDGMLGHGHDRHALDGLDVEGGAKGLRAAAGRLHHEGPPGIRGNGEKGLALVERHDALAIAECDREGAVAAQFDARAIRQTQHAALRDPCRIIREQRSEEHTSELQSLMRISYAVFCLNKTKLQTILQQ